ncbi:serpin family protein [Sphingosinicella sp. LHD-64]|uniref:serpin family protein n=1 Tax=Sphingosinicella sp. LHD-64 TaxID=3072139 RepID=UPI00280CAE09|nr:serpin family protein [Sphingosinicella sp. LHD-64]MDQ8757344.1 serpin family protein [Sphingosinicella sp. LHD-64]
MKIARLQLLAALAAVGIAAAAPAPAQRRDSQVITAASVAGGTRDFALRLYRELAREERDNIFFSPVSIALAITPLASGADGETRTGIQRALSLPEVGPELSSALGSLQRALERDRDRTQVSIANAIWLNRENRLRPEFLETARTHFEATAEMLDFGGDPRGAAARINRWADTETRGRIPSVVAPGQFNEHTRLVITNAVYFLADWQTPFEPESRAAPFTLADGRRIDVPTMEQLGEFRHHRRRGFAALDLPYRDERLVMTVLLPDSPTGLAALERSLTPSLLNRTLRSLDRSEPVRVDLTLPRFTLQDSYLLNIPLAQLGMGTAFALEADFRGVSAEPLRISRVTHSTFLRVDEQGTEAAAVTVVDSVIITGSRPMPPPIPFHADRAFMFMLRDRDSGAILFFGRIMRPSEVE